MLSVVAICKDEKKNVAGFIKSWSAVADEIVILDTGSTDGTWADLIEAEKENHKVRCYKTRWLNDFSVARNYAIRAACGTWILWADMDDRIDTASIPRLKEITKSNCGAAYEFQVASDVGNGLWNRFMQIRLFPNWPSLHFSGTIHENLNDTIKKNNVIVIREPEIIIAHLGYANVAVKKQKAVRNLELLLNIHPKSADVFAQIGDALYILEKFFVGLGYYEEACRMNAAARANLAEKLVIGYLSANALDKAEEILKIMPERSMSRFFWNGELHRIKGYLLAAQGSYYSAIHCGERSLESRECNGDVILSMANKRLEEMEAVCNPA